MATKILLTIIIVNTLNLTYRDFSDEHELHILKNELSVYSMNEMELCLYRFYIFSK